MVYGSIKDSFNYEMLLRINIFSLNYQKDFARKRLYHYNRAKMCCRHFDKFSCFEMPWVIFVI